MYEIVDVHWNSALLNCEGAVSVHVCRGHTKNKRACPWDVADLSPTSWTLILLGRTSLWQAGSLKSRSWCCCHVSSAASGASDFSHGITHSVCAQTWEDGPSLSPGMVWAGAELCIPVTLSPHEEEVITLWDSTGLIQLQVFTFLHKLWCLWWYLPFSKNCDAFGGKPRARGEQGLWMFLSTCRFLYSKTLQTQRTSWQYWRLLLALPQLRTI